MAATGYEAQYRQDLVRTLAIIAVSYMSSLGTLVCTAHAIMTSLGCHPITVQPDGIDVVPCYLYPIKSVGSISKGGNLAAAFPIIKLLKSFADK